MSEIFTDEQIEKLKQWKESLKSDVASEWKEREDKAEEEIHEILDKSGFEKGTDLTGNELDNIFHLMRNFSANRALSNLLYKENNLEEFNKRLRKLFYGEDSEFVKRVDEFFQFRGVGEQTLSQFLLAVDSSKYPLITSQTKEILELDSQQDEKAYQIALTKFKVGDSTRYLERTLDYLKDFIIFEEIKELLGLEKYTSVNNLIWFSRQVDDEEAPAEALKNYTSTSIEKDLRDYLADRPNLIENGLKLIKKEFDTKVAGQIDLLCKDAKGNMVVVELKKGKTRDVVVGQTLRYLGWVIENKDKKARAIIIVNESNDKLEYALKPIQDKVSLKYYKVEFKISEKYENN